MIKKVNSIQLIHCIMLTGMLVFFNSFAVCKYSVYTLLESLVSNFLFHQ